MAKTKNMNVYKRRQTILLIVIASILIVLIFILVYIIAFNDRKNISQKGIENTVLSSADSQLLAVDVQEGSVNKNNIDFEKDLLEIAVGQKITPTILNGSATDITNWQSSDNSVAVVDENGEITGIGVGIAGISAEVSGTDKLLTLRVDVVPSGEEESDGNVTSKNYEIYEEDGLTYVYDILIANKTYSLPEDYNPGEDAESAYAFYTMQEDAAYEGLDIYISSGFRSYSDQDRIYNNYASYDGYEAADRYSARPGHSEHQTGMAFDLNTIDESFAYTAEGEWVKENCHKYGFIIRYPEGKEEITGYMYEPWHVRYIGIEKATEVYESGLTLEEFLGIDSVYAD